MDAIKSDFFIERLFAWIGALLPLFDVIVICARCLRAMLSGIVMSRGYGLCSSSKAWH